MHFVREIYDNMETGICILRHVSQSFFGWELQSHSTSLIDNRTLLLNHGNAHKIRINMK